MRNSLRICWLVWLVVGCLYAAPVNSPVFNANPRFGSIISGMPGHPIEDVALSHIRIYYRGGGTAQQAALQPPEKENA